MLVCMYVLIFLPMDGHTYTVEIQTESYVTRYVGMSLFWPPMDDALGWDYSDRRIGG